MPPERYAVPLALPFLNYLALLVSQWWISIYQPKPKCRSFERTSNEIVIQSVLVVECLQKRYENNYYEERYLVNSVKILKINNVRLYATVSIEMDLTNRMRNACSADVSSVVLKFNTSSFEESRGRDSRNGVIEKNRWNPILNLTTTHLFFYPPPCEPCREGKASIPCFPLWRSANRFRDALEYITIDRSSSKWSVLLADVPRIISWPILLMHTFHAFIHIGWIVRMRRV